MYNSNSHWMSAQSFPNGMTVTSRQVCAPGTFLSENPYDCTLN